ncbi:hypothetical protein [Xanthomonas campestris]|jgi:phosphoglycerate-specific signal transduction histidine kinase|uniref:hypothetical protein n=1 Tax=Xanthomonas campestris TaxID=339 RepID=UPI002AD4A9B4|nr:hypothetical protein [Xanthomonas campestris]MEA0721977.1 hypothetical protein [Xanthomonas campestris pv. campestris]
MGGKSLQDLKSQRERLAERLKALDSEIAKRETKEFAALAKTYGEALRDAQAAGIDPEKLALAVASLTGESKRSK